MRGRERHRFEASTWCSVVATVACAAVPLVSAMLPEFNASRAWIFLIAAAAFASNLDSRLRPVLRGLAALAQAICVFEVLGFCVGLTALALTGTQFSGAPPWWMVGVGWGVLTACVFAMISSTYIALHTPAMADPE